MAPIQYFNNFGYFNIVMLVYSGRHIGLPLRLLYSFLFLWMCSGQADPAPTVVVFVFVFVDVIGGTHKGCPYGNFGDFFLVFTN